MSIEYILTKSLEIFNFDPISPDDSCAFDYVFDYGDLTTMYGECEASEGFKDIGISTRKCTMEYLSDDFSILNGQAFRDFEISVEATGISTAASGITV